MTPPLSIIATARAEALFVSSLTTGSTPNSRQATHAIKTALRDHGGIRGCAAEMASAFGDHPDTAVPRMRWARAVAQTLSNRPPEPGSHQPLPSAKHAGTTRPRPPEHASSPALQP